MQSFQALKQWLQDHGGVYPKRYAASLEESELAAWTHQVRATRSHTLRPARRASVEALPGWSWSLRQTRTLDQPRVPLPAKKYRLVGKQPRALLPAKKYRLVSKQPDVRAAYARPKCDAAGCASRQTSHVIVDGGSYCPRHAKEKRRQTAPHRGLVTLDDWSDDAVETHLLGPMTDKCECCASLNFPEERVLRGHFSICCNHGKTAHLPPFDDPGPVLHELLTASDARSNSFRKNIRSYNSALSFMSVGAKVVAPPGVGPPVYKVHGTVCHWSGDLLPAAGEDPVYAQLYIYDPSEALQKRLTHNPEAAAETMEALQTELASENYYTQSYRHMHELLLEIEAAAARDQTEVPEVTMRFSSDAVREPRRYNSPAVEEVAAVFVGADGGPPTHKDIVVYPRGHEKHRVSELHSCVDPMSYVLIFPRGSPHGWSPNLTHSSQPGAKTAVRTRLTALQYYAHRLMRREGASILPHATGRLFQQYCVDAYCKAEGQRLHWCRNNQDKLRTEEYQVLQDWVASQAPTQGASRAATPAAGATVPKVGRPVILPSTFGGGPRAMQMNYQDALAIVREFGKPDYFITFTANPAWPEIAQNLAQGEHAVNRPELVARVFHLKLKAMLKELVDESVLGKVAAHCWTIEFQKRGLPHAHILLIMRSEDKPRTKDDVDRVVSAELPDDNDPQQAELYALVSSLMVHGPCGLLAANKPCMNAQGVCSKGFPHDFADETALPQDQYPVYRRRDTGRCVEKNGMALDNRWVVPYNPYLVRRFKGHINVHVCTSIRAVKYLYKYIHKGHDRAAIEVVVRDEVKDFIDARYVGPPESCWRLLSFDMHGKSHVVERLPVHLPGRHAVLFDESMPAAAVATDQTTRLTAYFDLVKAGWRAGGMHDITASPLYYVDVPKWYVWNQKSKKWQARQRGGVVRVNYR